MFFSKKIILFSSILIVSCVKIIKNPVLEYNKEFLSKYNMQIRKSRKKHQNMAKEFGIYYNDDETKQLVDAEYYTKKINTKDKRNFRASGKSYDEKTAVNENTRTLGNDKSIYKMESNLKENKLSSLREEKDLVVYLEENYDDYKNERNVNRGVHISREKLYGSLDDRKKKSYYKIDNDELLVSFDYIDLLSRVKTDVYLQEQDNKTVKDTLYNIKDKIFNIFGGKKNK